MIIAGLRVGVVSSISLASVGQLIGVSSLGYLFIDGLQRSFPTEIYVGLVLVIALALVCDLILVGVRRALTPWLARATPGAHGARRQRAMSFFSYAWDWVTTSANWHGSDSIPQQVLAHLGYSGLPLLIAALIAIPAGVLIGHRGGGAVVVVNLANAWRAIPTLGLLILLAVYLGFSALTWLVPLVVLAIPPILVNAYEGVAGVDPGVRDAAKGMGMTTWQQIVQVEVPIALPLILVGLRTSADLRRRDRDDRRLHRPRRPRPLHHRRPGQHAVRPGGRRRAARRHPRDPRARALRPALQAARPGRAARAGRRSNRRARR